MAIWDPQFMVWVMGNILEFWVLISVMHGTSFRLHTWIFEIWYPELKFWFFLLWDMALRIHIGNARLPIWKFEIWYPQRILWVEGSTSEALTFGAAQLKLWDMAPITHTASFRLHIWNFEVRRPQFILQALGCTSKILRYANRKLCFEFWIADMNFWNMGPTAHAASFRLLETSRYCARNSYCELPAAPLKLWGTVPANHALTHALNFRLTIWIFKFSQYKHINQPTNQTQRPRGGFSHQPFGSPRPQNKAPTPDQKLKRALNVAGWL